MADALRRRLVGHEFWLAGRSQRITMSMGLTVYRPGDTVQAMLTRADQALYAAKDAGRNRVQTGG